MNFYSPTTITVCGMTCSGKSYFVRRLFRENMFNTPPNKIYWYYGIWQKEFDDMEGIEFHEGLPDSFDNCMDGTHNVLVFDDLAECVTKSNIVENLFTRGMHHGNITIIYCTQNLFYNGKNARNIALNSHYTILFKNPRAAMQVRTLASQTGLQHLTKAYEDAMKERYGYLVLDLCPHTDETYRLRTHIFPNEDVIVYQ